MRRLQNRMMRDGLLLCLLGILMSHFLHAADVEEGVSLFQAGRFAEAKIFFEELLQLHPDQPEALFYLGRLESDGASSQKYFQMICDLHPTHDFADDSFYALCQYRYAKGYYVSAGMMFRDLLATYPHSEYADDAMYWSGSCHLVAEHPDSALAAWRLLVTDHPESEWRVWAELGIGDALSARKKIREAIDQYRRILESSSGPDLTGAVLYRLVQCHESLGDSAAARTYFDRIVEEYPDSYEGLMLAGRRNQTPPHPVQKQQFYTVQVGAFAHKENAIRLHDRLAAQGYDVAIVTKTGDDGTLLHAVQIGSFQMKEDAQVILERLEQEERLQPEIITRSSP